VKFLLGAVLDLEEVKTMLLTLCKVQVLFNALGLFTINKLS
jgi:hypothetical protein